MIANRYIHQNLILGLMIRYDRIKELSFDLYFEFEGALW